MSMFDVRASRTQMATPPIAIYGNLWCGITQMIRRALDRAGIHYEFVDLDQHPSVHARLNALSGGRIRTPVVYVGGDWLVEPNLRQVQAALARHGVHM